MTKRKQAKKPAGTNLQIGVRAEPELIRAIDKWRAAQLDLPTRPEAIRRLAWLALPFSKEKL